MSDHHASRRIKNHLCGCESQGGLSSPMYVSSAPFHVSPGYFAWLRRRKTGDGGLTGLWRIRPRARPGHQHRPRHAAEAHTIAVVPSIASSAGRADLLEAPASSRASCWPWGRALPDVILRSGPGRVACYSSTHAVRPGNRMGSIRHSVFQNGPSVHVTFPIHRLA